jgi:hypothetical protein
MRLNPVWVKWRPSTPGYVGGSNMFSNVYNAHREALYAESRIEALNSKFIVHPPKTVLEEAFRDGLPENLNVSSRKSPFRIIREPLPSSGGTGPFQTFHPDSSESSSI